MTESILKRLSSRPAGRFRLRRAFGLERLVGLGLLVLFAGLYVADPYPVRFFRVKTFDMYQRLAPREVPPRGEKPVTIVDIDERSLREIGQWPWPRTTIARILVNLLRSGAKTVAFDVVFPEPDRTSPAVVADSIFRLDEATKAELRKLPSHDALFADLIGQARVRKQIGGRTVETGTVVLGQAVYFEETDDQRAESDPPPSKSVAWKGLTGDALPPTRFLPKFVAMIRNIPELEQAALAHGLFSLESEPDGVVRRVPTFFMKGEKFFPTLPVEMMRTAEYQKTVLIMTGSEGIAEVRIGKLQGGYHRIPTDRQGRVWPYFSKRDFDKYVSAADILNGSFDKSRVAGKMILIGTSATGLLDIRSTPVESIIPGVEVHAQFIETVLDGKLLQRPLWMQGAELSLLLAAGLLMIVLAPRIGARWSLALFLVIAGVAGGGSWYLFKAHLYLFDVGFVVVAVLLLYTQLTYTGYAREEAERRRVRNAFGFYLAPAMVEKLADDPSRLALGGEARDMTMLFCDVRGFTTISEQFDAEGLTRLINKLLTPLTDIIMQRRGTVDKYMGDCVMAFWNAPLDDADHARHAALAALAMNAEMAPLNQRLAAEAAAEGRRHIPLQIGIGVNSGEVVVGNMGSDQRFDYSVLGDQVNLAARLEGQCKTYAVDIILGENSVARAPGLTVLELDLIRVKGKTGAARIYTLIGDETRNQSNEFAALATLHDEMLAAYRGRRWQAARDKLNACRGMAGGFDLAGFYDLMDGRLAEFQANPPAADWDGVYVATSK